jgi:hypothetical protein
MQFWNSFFTYFFGVIVLLSIVNHPKDIQYFYVANNFLFGRFSHHNPASYAWNKYTELFWLISILFLALIVRSWNFGDLPPGINQDEAMGAVDAKALADYGTDRYGMKYPVHFTAWTYGQMSVLLSYLMIPFIKLWGLTEVTTRLPILIVSMGGLLALYGFIKNTFDKTSALIVLFIAAINPWHIIQSRWALDCNGFPHFFIIGCYFLSIAYKHRLFLHLSMVSFALCLYSYGVAFVVVPVFLTLLAIYVITKKMMPLKDILTALITYVFFSWPITAVMVINTLKLPTITTPFFTIPFFSGSVRSADILFFVDKKWDQALINIKCFLNVTLLQRKDLLWNQIDSFATVYVFSSALFILGTSVVIKKFFYREQNGTSIAALPRAHLGYAVILLGLVVCIWTGIVIATVNVNRINIIYYFLMILAGLGLAQIHKQFKVLFFIAVFVYIIFFGLFTQHYFRVYPEQIGRPFFAGFGKAMADAAKIDTPRYYISNSNGYTEILTLFHHQVDANYYRGEIFSASHPKLSSTTVAGNKYEVVYWHRYVYINPAQHKVDPNERAVYIVESYEKRPFDPNLFTITDYPDFSLIVPKHFNPEKQ